MGMPRAVIRLGSLFALLAGASCVLPELGLDGRPCPCAAGYRCDEATQTCVNGDGGGGSTGVSAGGAASGGAGPVLSFVDSALDGEFGEGSFDGTTWSADHVQLVAGAESGRFVSRVFDAGAPVRWSRIAWTPGGPYAKPLPDGRGAEQGYLDGNVDMRENTLLLHLDGSLGPLQPSLPDASGRSNHADVSGAGSPVLGLGVFGTALVDDMQSWLSVPVTAASDHQLGASDFSWSLWVRTTQLCPDTGNSSGNRVYLGAEENASNRTHIWFGCSSNLSACPDKDGTGRAGGWLRASNAETNDNGYCGKTVINDGRWHHMLMVKEGHSTATISLYVDGEPDQPGGPTVTSFGAGIDFESEVELTVGAFSLGTYQSAGEFDEVAFWRRALSPSEARAVYRRGARKLRFEVRACAQAGCADSPSWVATDANGAPLQDPPGALSPGTELTLPSLPTARYFQYRASFEKLPHPDPADTGPGLLEVRIGALP